MCWIYVRCAWSERILLVQNCRRICMLQNCFSNVARSGFTGRFHLEGGAQIAFSTSIGKTSRLYFHIKCHKTAAFPSIKLREAIRIDFRPSAILCACNLCFWAFRWAISSIWPIYTWIELQLYTFSTNLMQHSMCFFCKTLVISKTHFQFGEKFEISLFSSFPKIQLVTHQIAMLNKPFGINNFWQFSYS